MAPRLDSMLVAHPLNGSIDLPDEKDVQDGDDNGWNANDEDTPGPQVIAEPEGLGGAHLRQLVPFLRQLDLVHIRGARLDLGVEVDVLVESGGCVAEADQANAGDDHLAAAYSAQPLGYERMADHEVAICREGCG